MKKKQCIHVYNYAGFLGDPFGNTYGCKVVERCRLCEKQRTCKASIHDIQYEIDRLTCKSCGFLLKDHDNNGCIGLMSDLIRDLQSEIKSLQKYNEDRETCSS